jgi:hypothetical protein
LSEIHKDRFQNFAILYELKDTETTAQIMDQTKKENRIGFNLKKEKKTGKDEN